MECGGSLHLVFILFLAFQRMCGHTKMHETHRKVMVMYWYNMYEPCRGGQQSLILLHLSVLIHCEQLRACRITIR